MNKVRRQDGKKKKLTISNSDHGIFIIFQHLKIDIDGEIVRTADSGAD